MALIPVIPVELTDNLAQDKSLVIKLMAENSNEYLNNVTKFFQDVMNHEEEMDTDVLTDIALPHAKSGAVKTPFIVVGKYNPGIIWNNENKVKLVVMIGAPENADKEHLTIIAKLASNLADDDFIEELLNSDIQTVAKLIRGLYE
ncbi:MULTISPECIES: PTS sugar transporter subunit IIA [unclassified Gilliamella]|uniref:PTS sugar transporter subunit IIA n=1 Tax=unclassified Gilliamella TaxID=2685620 RepID=UPI00226AAE35|nr:MULTISPECIES: PTS sugar transporter subunit IIA [unclassified Gilliamella]MCX8596550.1 PTS sugar transporter subunit IIA [Gilliamella sp. B3493]MCX8599356.1 PTS sugar transporter subunit IIA [Gilliamella sp. B3486]MCX8689632.1 PTS sugar transporter subunit IIA [Gilliamella sp. B2973]MCX8705345.1 PTS sugar transporter subunit IIA [Gilliamella sp. B3127]